MTAYLRNDRFILLVLVLLSTTLAFLAGYGFKKFIKTPLTNIKTERSVSSKFKDIDKRNFESGDRTAGDDEHENNRYHDDGVKSISTSYIKEMLKYLTKEPHLGGTRGNERLGRFIKEEWEKLGFDKVESKEYNVLLSFPKEPANVSLVDELGNTLFIAKMTEEPFTEEENSTDSVYPFNAYSASGSIEAEYLYVNYGEVRDYEWLIEHNISPKGKIVIAKYGNAFRGEKARLAQEFGAAGVLLYADPEDFNIHSEESYPLSWNLPPGAIPRGNIANMKGDPLTPLYAAKDGMYRRPVESISHLTKIPVTPVSYADAYVLLSSLDDKEVPDPNWQGGLNFTYHITSKKKRLIKMSVNTPLEERKIENIVATIKGDTEPDRIILLGNHRDAWVFGAGDPSSGTACLMAVAKALGIMLSSGWRPKRTIMLLSWDAEEYGLMGSVEWVQEYRSVLSTRAVTYINVDIAVSGNYSVRAKASPVMIDKFFEVTKMFTDPDTEMNDSKNTSSVYESWREKNRDPVNKNEPMFKMLGSGSDFVPFYSMVGVPALDMRYEYDPQYYKKLSNYPSYHTIYDNYNYFTKFVDPDFRYHTLIAKLLLRYSTELADVLVLPFNLTRYSKKILQDVETFDLTFQELLRPHNISMVEVRKAASELVVVAEQFHSRLRDLNKNDCYGLRRYNDQMMYFERSFILPEGIPGRPNTKHMLYSQSRNTLFSRNIFPGVSEALYDIEVYGKDRWDDVKEQISIIVSCLNNAKNSIMNFGDL